jgi:Xaa-Pro dipeptidase
MRGVDTHAPADPDPIRRRDEAAPLSSSLTRRRWLAATAAGSAALAACSERRETDDDAARRAELFAHLEDVRPRFTPIGRDERAARRRRLGRLLAESAVDAYLCEPGATLRHLARVSWGLSERLFALVVLADGSHFFLVPAFEAEKARLQLEADDGPGGEIVTWDEHEYAFAPLASALEKRRVQRIAVDPYLRMFAAESLAARLGPQRVVSGALLRTRLRAVKEPRELDLMRAACEATQLALSAVAATLEPGVTGGEISARVDVALSRLGLVRTWDLSLVGEAAAYPHGGTSSRAVAKGDFVLVDCGGEFLEYQSDITRTWCPFGPPDPQALAAWRAVHDAQRRAFDVVAAGRTCGEVDRAAREVIERHGFGGDYAFFTHRLGHGIGLEGHEDPYFDSGSTVVLEPGMTLSNEPGIYVLNRFGIRLEDVLAVTPSGCEIFGAPQESADRPGRS